MHKIPKKKCVDFYTLALILQMSIVYAISHKLFVTSEDCI